MTKPRLASILAIRLAALATAILIAALSQVGLAYAEGIQPMGLLKGSVVSFGSTTNQYLPAFCLELGKSPPPMGGSFENYRGTVHSRFLTAKPALMILEMHSNGI